MNAAQNTIDIVSKWFRLDGAEKDFRRALRSETGKDVRIPEALEDVSKDGSVVGARGARLGRS